MKYTKSIVCTLLCLVVFSSLGFAASALNNPGAVAVDAMGNLWVANQGANNILKFNTSYVLQPKATITAGINTPTGIAVDALGNLWHRDRQRAWAGLHLGHCQQLHRCLQHNGRSPAGDPVTKDLDRRTA